MSEARCEGEGDEGCDCEGIKLFIHWSLGKGVALSAFNGIIGGDNQRGGTIGDGLGSLPWRFESNEKMFGWRSLAGRGVWGSFRCV